MEVNNSTTDVNESQLNNATNMDESQQQFYKYGSQQHTHKHGQKLRACENDCVFLIFKMHI